MKEFTGHHWAYFYRHGSRRHRLWIELVHWRHRLWIELMNLWIITLYYKCSLWNCEGSQYCPTRCHHVAVTDCKFPPQRRSLTTSSQASCRPSVTDLPKLFQDMLLHYSRNGRPFISPLHSVLPKVYKQEHLGKIV